MTPRTLDAAATADALPWRPLMAAIEQVMAAQRAGQVQVPERSVHPIAPDTRWFVMPAWSAPEAGGIAIAKLITYNPHNAGRGLAAILGDVTVLRSDTGERLALLDGPTVTSRRTAAVTGLALQRLARCADGPVLMFGAGAQAHAHLEMLHAVFGPRPLWLRSRGATGARRLLDRARALGWQAHLADDLPAAVARCPLIVAATPATAPCLVDPPRDDAFVAAVGAFTPAMAEIGPDVVRAIARRGAIVLDTESARHEAGDLLQAGVAPDALPVLADVDAQLSAHIRAQPGPVLFKSCGSALWDLAAGHCVAR